MNDVKIIDVGLLIGKTLVFGDVHIGYEEALNKEGFLIPRTQLSQLVETAERMLKRKPETIVINGDLKHEFGTISETEWRNTLRFIDYLSTKCKKLVLVKGNHDTILGPIAKKRNIEVVDHYSIGEVYICHGDKIPKNAKFKKAKTIVIGHEHPAVSIGNDVRVEKYKCFLFGKYKDKRLIIMPSFLQTIEGSDVTKEKPLSPFVKKYDDFDVYVVEKEIMRFGKVKDL